MTRAGIDTVVGDAWRRCTAAGTPEWVRGLGASDIRRTVGRAVAAHRMQIPAPALRPRGGGGRLGREDTTMLDEQEAQDLEAWLCGPGWTIIEHLCRVARRLRDDTVTTLRERGVRVVPRDVGLWALSAVARRYWPHGVCPSVADLGEEAATFRERRAGEDPLLEMRFDDDAFAAAAGPEWDRVWPPDRPPDPSPSTSGLGADRRPPLLGRRGDWRTATDRPVQARYLRCFDTRSRVPAPDVDPGRHVTRRYADRDPREIVLAEVHRAAAPLGLSAAGHTPSLVAVAHGLRANSANSGDARTGPRLGEWAAADAALPAEPDPVLTRAVTRFAASWARNTALAGELDAGGVQLVEGVARRVWHRLHGREIEWDTPYDRPQFAEVVRKSFDVHLRTYDAPPAAGPGAGTDGTGPPDPADPPPPDPPDAPDAAEDLGDAERLTFDLIGGHERGRELVALLAAGDPAWPALYREIVAGVAGVLGVDEMRRFGPDVPDGMEGS